MTTTGDAELVTRDFWWHTVWMCGYPGWVFFTGVETSGALNRDVPWITLACRTSDVSITIHTRRQIAQTLQHPHQGVASEMFSIDFKSAVKMDYVGSIFH